MWVWCVCLSPGVSHDWRGCSVRGPGLACPGRLQKPRPPATLTELFLAQQSLERLGSWVRLH